METRTEYPRPQFRRDNWQTLNGEWQFAFDDKDEGLKRGFWSGKKQLGKIINVPFTYEYEASGIGDTSRHPVVWYRREFTVADENRGKGALLCFNGCDYIADVWVNGVHVSNHKGGFSPFSADITNALKKGKNIICVRSLDPDDPAVPRGKQTWTGKPFACWYVPNTGIWQSVWIEYFGSDAISAFTVTPHLDDCSFSGEINTLRAVAEELEISVTFKGRPVKKQTVTLDGGHSRYSVSLMEPDFVDEAHYWTPEHPNLFYIDLKLKKGARVIDEAHTRFGMREITIDECGQICLNRRKLYQRLVLDQGYWKESGLTPPSAESLKKDIELAKAFGFNGARKHQKFEDPYFYYYADELGFLVWCEMPSAYDYCPREVAALSSEWQEIVAAARNFTSVICYVPLNESWGVRKILSSTEQQDFARSMYYLTKSVDNTRLISTNDGWENIDVTDVISIHDYAYDSSEFAEKYSPENYDAIYPQGRKLMVEGCSYAGQPVLFTEFGGIAMKNSAIGENWGYGDAAKSGEELIARYENLLEGVYSSPFQGYCVTQLTDVQQEVNGLCDVNRNPKVNPELLKNIFYKKD